jgi:predicted nucleic acid-binding protein
MIVADTNLIVYLFITGDQSTSAQKLWKRILIGLRLPMEERIS